MTRTLLISALFFTATFATAASERTDVPPTEQKHTLEAPAPSLPDWAETRLPDRPQTTDAPVGQVSPPDPPADPNPVPLDGGLGLLALAGAGYAASKLRKRRGE